MRKSRIAMASLAVTSALTAGAWTLTTAAVPPPIDQVVVPMVAKVPLVIQPDPTATDTTGPDRVTARMLAMELRLQALVKKRDAEAAAAARAAAAAQPTSPAWTAPATYPASATYSVQPTYAPPTYAPAPSSAGAPTTSTTGAPAKAATAPTAHTTTGASGAITAGEDDDPVKTPQTANVKTTKDGQDD